MSKKLLDAEGAAVAIPCPNCERQIPEPIWKLRMQGGYTCLCGTFVAVDLTAFDQGLAGAEDRLKKAFKKIRL